MFECPILLADFRILLKAEYEYVVRQTRNYHATEPFGDTEADLVVSVSPEEIKAERATISPDIPDGLMPDGYLESICLYRHICRELPAKGAMLLHAAVISDGQWGYAFTADSGTGKTTHIRQWKAAFGSRIEVINGDKPLIRLIDGTWYAYGTPWCGKEGWHQNARVPLGAICFLRRGETNTIRPYPAAEALASIMPQLLLPEEPTGLIATLDMLDSLLTEIPLFELHCTISPEAAHVAHEAMSRT